MAAERDLNLHTLWDYNDPAGTRTKFESLLATLPEDEAGPERWILMTQIARTYSLQREFAHANAILDQVEPVVDSSPQVRMNYLLERGRTYRSSGALVAAYPLFIEAFELGLAAKLEALTIDAAHMIALVESSSEAKIRWQLRGIELAEAATEPRAKQWLGALLNNLGWDYHDAGQFDQALEIFQKSYEFRKTAGDWKTTAIAKYTVGRALRSLDRIDEALKIQLETAAEYEAHGQKDGYVFEEIAELKLALGETSEARAYFAQAYQELSRDVWLSEAEPARLERMKRLSEESKR